MRKFPGMFYELIDCAKYARVAEKHDDGSLQLACKIE